LALAWLAKVRCGLVRFIIFIAVGWDMVRYGMVGRENKKILCGQPWYGALCFGRVW